MLYHNWAGLPPERHAVQRPAIAEVKVTISGYFEDDVLRIL